MGAAKPELKAEAIRLRTKKRLSLREIAALTGAAKGSLSLWLKPYPLTEEEKRARSKTSRRYITPKKDRGKESQHHKAIAWQNLSNQRKGKIAEAAILFRLALYGFDAYISISDGNKADWLVEIPERGKVIKLQVRSVCSFKHGLPGILLTCAQGHNKRRRYERGEFDFIVGYNLFNDTAYVFSFDEVARNRTFVAISGEHAERWDKLKA
jgi:transcriptional regulator with XRE-family HTH domain